MTDQTIEQLLPLDSSERIVRIGEGGCIYRHVFSPLSIADWKAYFASFHSEILTTGRRSQIQTRENEAGIDLWDSKVLRVEGYKGTEAPSPEQLRSRMPMGHKLAAVEVLLDCVSSEFEGEELDLLSEESPVVLSAKWNGNLFDRLVHRFQRPSQKDELRHRRLNATSYEVRGSRRRNMRSLLPSKFSPLCELYDQLILRVEGYAVNGQALEKKEDVLRHMDGTHKIVAMGVLLGEPPSSEEEAEEADATT